MSVTQLHGTYQIFDGTIDRDKLVADFLEGSDLNLTNGNNDATITGLADPTNAQDAATKAYVDAIASGLTLRKAVRLATATSLPANTASGSGVGKTLTADANGALSVDGVTPSVSDRILVKDEGTGVDADNGVYVVTTVGDGSNPWVLTRAEDCDGSPSGEVVEGLFIFVGEGTANADTGWVIITNNPITVDTTAIEFTQFSGAGTYTGGNGIDISSGVISADVDGTTLENTKGTGDQIGIKDGGVDTTQLASGAVTADKIDTDAVNETHLDFGSGANQVDATSIPLDTGGTYAGSATTVQDALEEIEGSIVTYTGGNGIDITTGTISADVDGTSIINTGGSGDQIAINADGVDETHIDWGSGANQVDASSMPLDTGGTYAGSATNVQDALEELESSISATKVWGEAPTVTNGSAVVTLANTPTAGTVRVYLNGNRKQAGAGNDYTISGATITFWRNLVNTGPITEKVLVDYEY